MSVGADAKRLMIATASGALGRAGKAESGVRRIAQLRRTTGDTSAMEQAAGRAEQDPMVRRMKEKFGAEIRTIIDYQGKALVGTE